VKAARRVRREAAWKRPGFTQHEHGTSPGGPPYHGSRDFSFVNWSYVHSTDRSMRWIPRMSHVVKIEFRTRTVSLGICTVRACHIA
jgi:hypothetical protein